MEPQRVMENEVHRVMEKEVQTVEQGGIPSERGKKENLRAEKKTTQQVYGKPAWHLCKFYKQIILPPQTKSLFNDNIGNVIMVSGDKAF